MITGIVNMHPAAPSTKPSVEKPLTTTSEKGPPTTPFKDGSIMKILNKKPESRTPDPWPPIRPFDNVHLDTPFGKLSPFEKVSTVRPFDHLPRLKHEDPVDYWSLPKYKYKFVFVTPTTPPFRRIVDTGALVIKLIGGAAGLVLLLMIISSLSKRKHRNRRGVVRTAAAGAVELDIQADRSPSEPGEPGPPNLDLPPPYYECRTYNKNKSVGEEPPPYTDPGEHKQQQGAFIENERRACSEDAPEMKTELVFDNGRTVETLSLDQNNRSRQQ